MARHRWYWLGWAHLVTVEVAAFLVLTESYPTPPHELGTPMLVTILVFCPASLLSALFIDAEIGTSGFYFIWFFIALFNAALYAAVDAGGRPHFHICSSKAMASMVSWRSRQGQPSLTAPPHRPGRALIRASGSYRRKSFAGWPNVILFGGFRGSFPKATPDFVNHPL